MKNKPTPNSKVVELELSNSNWRWIERLAKREGLTLEEVVNRVVGALYRSASL